MSYLDENSKTNNIVTKDTETINYSFLSKKISKFSEIQLSGLYDLKEEINKEYSIGYSYFEKSNPYSFFKGNAAKVQKQELKNALKYFRNYIHQYNIPDSNNFRVALLRIADAYFLLRDDSLAIENYARSITVGDQNHSYALHQMATSQGLIQDYEGKINTLKTILKKKYFLSIVFDCKKFSMLCNFLIKSNFKRGVLNV